MTAALRLPDFEDKQDWTVDDLANLPEDLRYELIDGRLILPSPTALHQDTGVRVLLALEAHCPPDRMVVTDLSLQINRRNEPRPDVVVISVDHATRSPVPVEDALLAVEIVSPSSHFRDMYAKARVFAAAGIENYWVVDPTFEQGMVLTVYRLGPTGEYEAVHSTDKVFSTDVPYPVTIDLPALSDRRRALAERAKP